MGQSAPNAGRPGRQSAHFAVNDSTSFWPRTAHIRFFEGEGQRVRDVRRRPLKFAEHSISFRMGQGKWHPSVRIELERYREVKAYFEEVASKKSVETLSRELHTLPFQPFAPVRGQLFNVLRALNRKRAAGGLEPVAVTALRLRRAPVKVFT